MNINFSIFISPISFLMAFCLGSCSSDNDMERNGHNTPLTPIELKSETRRAADDLRDFYLSFTYDMIRYADANSNGASSNVVLSPLSASMVFAMVANGLDDNGAKAYADYLGCKNLNALNDLCSVLISKLPKADGMVKLSLANSIWVNSAQNITLSKEYTSTLNTFFKSELFYHDFTKDTSTLKEMNNWCARNTNNLIPSFVEEVKAESLAVLFNTLYFDGFWKDGLFEPKDTKTELFHGKEGNTKVEMMKSKEYTGTHVDNGELELFSIPFGNSAFNMTILLPNQDESVERVVNTLTPDLFKDLQTSAETKFLTIEFPKFSVKSKFEINDMLIATGRKELIDNLGLTMFPTERRGSLIYSQGTSLTVTEKGAEAAAVTEGEIMDSAPFFPSHKVKVDRSFLFFITEYSTGAMILSGRISDI